MAKNRGFKKKDIKQPDEFLTFSQRVMAYVRDNKKKVYGIIIGILLASALYTGGWSYWRYVNKRAMVAYGSALTKFRTTVYDEQRLKSEGDIVKKMFQDIPEKHPISSVAKLVHPFLGHFDFIKGDVEKATEEFREFSKKVGSNKKLYSLSQLALSKCLEEKGDLEGALRLLESLETDPNDPTHAFLLYQKARLLKLLASSKGGEAREQARNAIKALKDSSPDFPLLPVLEVDLGL